MLPHLNLSALIGRNLFFRKTNRLESFVKRTIAEMDSQIINHDN